jgi:ribonuclease E
VVEAAEEDADAGGRKRRRRRRRKRRGAGESEVEQATDQPVAYSADGPPPLGEAPYEQPRPEVLAPETPVVPAEPQPEAALEMAAEVTEKRPRRRRRRSPRAEAPAFEPVPQPVAAHAPNGADGELAAPPGAEPQPDLPEPEELPVPLTPSLANPPDRLQAAAHDHTDEGGAEEGSRNEASGVPPAAMVDRGAGEPPRRGWWSRFVRKDD